MARDFKSTYQRIAAEIAEKIETGELEDGERLPTRPELEAKYGVSRQVVRDALALLHTDGYVVSAPSSSGGTFVQRPALIVLPMTDFEADLREADAFDVLVDDLGRVPHQKIKVETVALGTLNVPRWPELDPGTELLVRRRVRYVDDVPYSISDSYYPRELVQDSVLARPANISRGARHVLHDMGLGLDHHRDSIRSRRPHDHEVQTLGIAPGLSVLAHTRISYTADDQPVRLLASVLPSDRWELTYEVR